LASSSVDFLKSTRISTERVMITQFYILLWCTEYSSNMPTQSCFVFFAGRWRFQSSWPIIHKSCLVLMTTQWRSGMYQVNNKLSPIQTIRWAYSL